MHVVSSSISSSGAGLNDCHTCLAHEKTIADLREQASNFKLRSEQKRLQAESSHRMSQRNQLQLQQQVDITKSILEKANKAAKVVHVRVCFLGAINLPCIAKMVVPEPVKATEKKLLGGSTHQAANFSQQSRRSLPTRGSSIANKNVKVLPNCNPYIRCAMLVPDTVSDASLPFIESSTCFNSQDPVWHEEFIIPGIDEHQIFKSSLHFTVFNHGLMDPSTMVDGEFGDCTISLEKFVENSTVEINEVLTPRMCLIKNELIAGTIKVAVTVEVFHFDYFLVRAMANSSIPAQLPKATGKAPGKK